MDCLYVNKTLVEMYEEPSCNSMVVDELLYGMKVTIVRKLFSEWALVRTFYGYEGYVKTNKLICTSMPENRREMVLASVADVLEKPDIKTKRIYTLLRGSIVFKIIRESNGYTEIVLQDGRIGYIKTSALCPYREDWSISEESNIRKGIVNVALSYLDTQYRWGGKSSMGIDCSGLSFMSYYMNGIIIWRDSYIHQRYPVHAISFDDIGEGDLIYFQGHVAIYIGNNKYVHSTNRLGSDGVVINSLNEQDINYRKDLAGKIIAIGSVF